MGKKYILDAGSVGMKLQRMAFEIIENNLDEQEVFLVGIHSNGTAIAQNMQRILEEIGPVRTKLVNLVIDKKHPGEVTLSSEEDYTGKVIIIVDDVANSGKTMMYALMPFLEFHPKKFRPWPWWKEHTKPSRLTWIIPACRLPRHYGNIFMWR